MKSMFVFLLTMVCLTGVSCFADSNVHSFTMTRIDGTEQSLSDYKGKVLLIVNTASNCGFTYQLGQLQDLYDQYKDQGFEVLAFPANNFLNQEPGTNAEIKKFCRLNYRTEFPLFSKSSVKGKNINPLYQYLTEQSPFPGNITWNFNKFLVDQDGNVVDRFDSRDEPLSDKVSEAVNKVLQKAK